MELNVSSSGPQDHPTAIERAFVLAETGRYVSTGHIKAQLRPEG